MRPSATASSTIDLGLSKTGWQCRANQRPAGYREHKTYGYAKEQLAMHRNIKRNTETCVVFSLNRNEQRSLLDQPTWGNASCRREQPEGAL